MRALAIAAAATMFLPLSAFGADTVRIEFKARYPNPGQSSEAMEIKVSRDASSRAEKHPVDAYFEAVRSALQSAKAPAKWQPSPPIHAPIVTVEVTIGAQHYLLVAGYSKTGPAIPLDASESEKAVYRAFETILQLTIRRAQARLATK